MVILSCSYVILIQKVDSYFLLFPFCGLISNFQLEITFIHFLSRFTFSPQECNFLSCICYFFSLLACSYSKLNLPISNIEIASVSFALGSKQCYKLFQHFILCGHISLLRWFIMPPASLLEHISSLSLEYLPSPVGIPLTYQWTTVWETLLGQICLAILLL